MGASFHWCGLHDGPLDGRSLASSIAGPDAGCTLEFRGTVRGQAHGRAVVHLDYEAYAPMVEAELARIVAELATEHEFLRIAVAHSVGRVPVGGCSVIVAVASAHRAAAFSAGAALMDALKERVPIWKREVDTAGGSWLGQGS